jgi:hypothetical protein
VEGDHGRIVPRAALDRAERAKATLVALRVSKLQQALDRYHHHARYEQHDV